MAPLDEIFGALRDRMEKLKARSRDKYSSDSSLALTKTILTRRQPKCLLERTGILSLPVELVQQITGLLPATSRAALSLTCHRMLYILGTNQLKTLDESWRNPERFTLLELLGQDMPNHVFCRFCALYYERIHQRPRMMKNLFPIASATSNPWLNLHLRAIDFGGRIRIGNLDVGDNSSINNTLQQNFSVCTYRTFIDGHTLTLDFWTIRILSSKIQDARQLPRMVDCHGFCPHAHHAIYTMSTCAIKHDRKGSMMLCNSCGPLHRCHSCPSEYLVNVGDATGGGHELRIYWFYDHGEVVYDEHADRDDHIHPWNRPCFMKVSDHDPRADSLVCERIMKGQGSLSLLPHATQTPT